MLQTEGFLWSKFLKEFTVQVEPIKILKQSGEASDN